MAAMSGGDPFDKKLAVECARAFSASTGLGCTVSEAGGAVLAECGRSCPSCGLCAAVGQPGERCVSSHVYGMTEAERFGGKYIYFCPMGLTCFVSPIVGSRGSAAKITVGPFIMVERQDFYDCELAGSGALGPEELARAARELEGVPYVAPGRVTELSTLLFMAVGFMNNVAAENRMIASSRSDELQGQISSYIMQLKEVEAPPPYPFETERQFLQSISRGEKPQAQKYLNELLGAILFTGGGDLDRIKSRIAELLVLISRTAVTQGSDPEQTLRLSHAHLQAIPRMRSIDELCYWLSGVVNRYMDGMFGYADARHAGIIHRCIQHMGAHCGEKITLEQAARMVYLSPPYLSRVFKKETGVTFNEYLNSVRIGKAKELLGRPDLRLTDIALMVGYEDQSYFTKVFKRIAGCAPSQYRNQISH